MEKKRLAEKERRARLKSDQQHAKKQREKWHVRKKAKKVVPIAELKPRDQARRRQQNQWK